MGNYWTICPVVKKGVKGLLFIDDLCAKVHFIHNSFMLLDFGNLYQKNIEIKKQKVIDKTYTRCYKNNREFSSRPHEIAKKITH